MSIREQLSTKKYEEILNKSRIPGQEVKITKEAVIAGLKFIAENKDLNQEELIQGLFELGCNFTIEEINTQFPNIATTSIVEGIKNADLATGACAIVSACSCELGRIEFEHMWMEVDNELSIYNFIRVATGDDLYTKENLTKRKR